MAKTLLRKVRLSFGLEKTVRFVYRTARNLICMTSLGRRLLFPPNQLARRFGPSDAEYAVRVFVHHYRQLAAAGFVEASRILEVGPGQNLGTSLLMWTVNYLRKGADVEVWLWDIFPNMMVDSASVQQIAESLLKLDPLSLTADINHEEFHSVLERVAIGILVPRIRYVVCPLNELEKAVGAGYFDLICSQAVIEHIWNVAEFWSTIIRLTAIGGWHSHRIDLADHGRRETNYLEMLEWSPFAYWLTQRYVPGAINRWRAQNHLDFMRNEGMFIKFAQRQLSPELLISRKRIHWSFRNLPEIELLTTGLDVVATKSHS